MQSPLPCEDFTEGKDRSLPKRFHSDKHGESLLQTGPQLKIELFLFYVQSG